MRAFLSHRDRNYLPEPLNLMMRWLDA